MEDLKRAVTHLLSYVESESYRGYDPYDALLSPFFNVPLIRKNITVRFFGQQLVKRCPLNVRPLLLIPKGLNPVTMGLSIQAYACLIKAFPENSAIYNKQAVSLIAELKSLIPKGFSGACWGYDFPWQARYADIPAFQPTIVATGIITNGLYMYYKISGNKEALELIKSAADFTLNDLRRTYDGNAVCFSYSPFDSQQVYNASAKAVRLLAQVYAETSDEKLLVPIRSAVEYIINRQQANGSWYYSEAGRWVDNYHTGYVLDCLDEYVKCTGDQAPLTPITKGVAFYRNNFFTREGIPRLKSNKTFPVDCTSAGQSLLSLVRFGEIELAEKVANWMIENMQSGKGYFYYRKGKLFTQKTSFMRWSNAWMLAGLASLLAQRS